MGLKDFFLYQLIPWILTISTIISVLFFAGIVYISSRISKIRRKERENVEERPVELVPVTSPVSSLEPAGPAGPEEAFAKLAYKEPEGRAVWNKILTQVDSFNPSDWKVAVLEADIMLDKMLIGMGYKGETLGERLKSLQYADFHSLDAAWEAHKARNRIAHTGGDYVLTQAEARRAIELYGKVFDEFKYV